jgi:P4 family phage/plasmid primase-like protien
MRAGTKSGYYGKCARCDPKDFNYDEDAHARGVENCTAHPGGGSRCHGLYAATTDPDVIRAWWFRDPFDNIGINCGRSSLVLIDTDVTNGKDGESALAELVAANTPLPTGPHAQTASGGQHRLFRPPPGVTLGNSSSLLGPGIDIKATGGLMIAAPSIVADGRPAMVKGQYVWLNDPWQEIPELPMWVVEEIERKKATAPAPRPYTGGTGATSVGVQDRVTQLADEAAMAPQGHRNNVLFQNAVKAFEYANAGQIDHDEVEFIFTQAGLHADNDESMVRGTVASARRKAIKEYRWVTRGNSTAQKGQDMNDTVEIPEPRDEITLDTRGPEAGILKISTSSIYARKGDQMGAAELYVEDCDGGYPLRWNGHSERFYHYAEGCWREDDKRNTRLGGLVDSLARHVTTVVDRDIDMMRKQMADGEGDKEVLKELIKIRPNWYKTYRSAGGRAGILSFISTSVEQVASEDMDADPHLLNFTNGTYDVRTGKLRQADPNDYLTHRVDTGLDTALAEKPLEEVAPLFYGLLRRAAAAPGEVDEETARQRIEAVVRGLGSMISGECGDKAMLVFEGETNIGKTVILEIMQTLLGQQLATSSKPNLLIKTRGDKHDATEYTLKGRRFVLVNELTTQMTLDEGQVLRLINPGGSTLTVRRLGQQEENINITWTIAITTNELPRARVTPQVLGRTVIYPMSRVEVPRDQQDRTLRRRILKDEGAAVLAHLVRWWREWYEASQNGGKGLIITEEMTRALAEFKDDNATSASLFRDERTMADPNGTVKATMLWSHFNDWLETQQPDVRREYQMGRTAFYKEIETWEGVEAVFEHKAGRNPVRKAFKGFSLVNQDGIPIP